MRINSFDSSIILFFSNNFRYTDTIPFCKSQKELFFKYINVLCMVVMCVPFLSNYYSTSSFRLQTSACWSLVPLWYLACNKFVFGMEKCLSSVAFCLLFGALLMTNIWHYQCVFRRFHLWSFFLSFCLY